MFFSCACWTPLALSSSSGAVSLCLCHIQTTCPTISSRSYLFGITTTYPHSGEHRNGFNHNPLCKCITWNKSFWLSVTAWTQTSALPVDMYFLLLFHTVLNSGCLHFSCEPLDCITMKFTARHGRREITVGALSGTTTRHNSNKSSKTGLTTQKPSIWKHYFICSFTGCSLWLSLF